MERRHQSGSYHSSTGERSTSRMGSSARQYNLANRAQETSRRRSSTHGIRGRISRDVASFGRSSEHVTRLDRLAFNKDTMAITRRDDDSNSNRSSSSEDLNDILKRTWKLYRVSPLFGFEYYLPNLKQYGRVLRNLLKSSKIGSSKIDIEYHVKFTVRSGLRWTDIDNEAIQIEVTGIIDGGAPRSLYLGVFLSWGKANQLTGNHFVHLPLMLHRGGLRTATRVHAILHKMFDCCITNLEINHEDLMWLSAINNVTTDRTYRSVARLHYKCPLVLSGDIIVSLPVPQIQELWRNIHPPNNTQVLHTEICKFHDHLFAQQEAVLRMENENIMLHSFDFPSMAMTIQGKVKMRSLEAVENALSYLSTSACILESANPSLSVSVDI